MAFPEIVAPVLRCRYCSREMTVSAAAYGENPFCDGCLSERVERAADKQIEWRTVGDYFEPIRPQES